MAGDAATLRVTVFSPAAGMMPGHYDGRRHGYTWENHKGRQSHAVTKSRGAEFFKNFRKDGLAFS